MIYFEYIKIIIFFEWGLGPTEAQKKKVEPLSSFPNPQMNF